MVQLICWWGGFCQNKFVIEKKYCKESPIMKYSGSKEKFPGGKHFMIEQKILLWRIMEQDEQKYVRPFTGDEKNKVIPEWYSFKVLKRQFHFFDGIWKKRSRNIGASLNSESINPKSTRYGFANNIKNCLSTSKRNIFSHLNIQIQR